VPAAIVEFGQTGSTAAADRRTCSLTSS